MLFVPQVKSIQFISGAWIPEPIIRVNYEPKVATSFQELKRWLKVIKVQDEFSDIHFAYDPLFREEQYRLTISVDKVLINYKTPKGAFYAVKTLKQIWYQYPHSVPCLIIDDEPDLSIRGYMLDISRDKIPTLKTLYHLIDLLSDLKFNHFELYVEGFSYLYPSFKSFYSNETPLTSDDYQKLETCCHKRMIDFVPCHNSFGHMSAWLARDEFRDLAIIPEGMEMWGAHREASTLNPLDPRSFELVKTYYEDVLTVSHSHYFHMNMDEPYELGVGKTTDEAKKVGVGNLYFDYFMKLYTLLKSHGKIPMMWGDVWNHHPELIAQLPKDICVVDWGYDMDYPFEKTLKRLAENHVPFLAAPGTSSWNSVTGRTMDMLETIHQACFWTKQYHGEGVLLTDWGDHGHQQVQAISYPAMVYMSLESWSSGSGHYRLLVDYLNRFIFKDSSNIMGELLLDLGRYNRFQSSYMYNATFIMPVIWSASDAHKQPNPLEFFKKSLQNHDLVQLDKFMAIKAEMISLSKRLKQGKMGCNDHVLIRKELTWSIDLLLVLFTSIALTRDQLKPSHKNRISRGLITQWQRVLSNHDTLWLARNRLGGMAHSASYLDRVYEIVRLLLQEGK